jgi:hypothetical protein
VCVCVCLCVCRFTHPHCVRLLRFELDCAVVPQSPCAHTRASTRARALTHAHARTHAHTQAHARARTAALTRARTRSERRRTRRSERVAPTDRSSRSHKGATDFSGTASTYVSGVLPPAHLPAPLSQRMVSSRSRHCSLRQEQAAAAAVDPLRQGQAAAAVDPLR